jgi:hypothetical protein
VGLDKKTLFQSSRQLVGRHDARIRVPGQQRILTTACLCVPNVGPTAQEILLRVHMCEVLRDGTVDVFHDGEFGGEENVKVALLDLAKRRKWESQLGEDGGLDGQRGK